LPYDESAGSEHVAILPHNKQMLIQLYWFIYYRTVKLTDTLRILYTGNGG
jgi:hypothetical protein